jgi:hypothetical protein
VRTHPACRAVALSAGRNNAAINGRCATSAAEVLAIIRARCADILTDAELSLVVRLPAIEGPPKPQPTVRADRDGGLPISAGLALSGSHRANPNLMACIRKIDTGGARDVGRTAKGSMSLPVGHAPAEPHCLSIGPNRNVRVADVPHPGVHASPNIPIVNCDRANSAVSNRQANGAAVQVELLSFVVETRPSLASVPQSSSFRSEKPPDGQTNP